MVKLDIKALSVNMAWQGRRFKTPAYKKYWNDVQYLLPKMKLPEPPYEIYLEFGFSSKGSDWDNGIKPILDIISDYYGFNDNLIYLATVKKVIVKKGQEYIKFKIKQLNK